MRTDGAQRLFEHAGLDFQDLKMQSQKRGFQAVPMGLEAQLKVKSKVEPTQYSNNVLAILPGEGKSNEAVMISAHWDHVGMIETDQAKEIFNGAMDNAAGVAGVLELARVLKAQGKAFKRSIIFANFTAEESGLLGAMYLVQYLPALGVDISAVLNIEGLNVIEAVDTIYDYGPGGLEDYIQDAVDAQGRVIKPEPMPQDGKKFRSDHLAFGLKGIPWLLFWWLDEPDYVANRYHQTTDIYNPNWSMQGAAQALQLISHIAETISNS